MHRRCAGCHLDTPASLRITGAPCLVLLSGRGYGAVHGGALFKNAHHAAPGFVTPSNPGGLVTELWVGIDLL